MIKERIHFFEIEDLESCPRPLRDGITDILQFSINFGRFYSPVVPVLAHALKESGTTRVVDLCSGGGGPWPSLLPKLSRKLKTEVSVVLTDLFPNHKAFERTQKLLGDSLEYETDSVSAFDVPEKLRGFRTIFTGLHHFQPDQAKKIIADAVRKGDGIGVFEFTHRSYKGYLFTAMAPVGVLLTAPFVRPFRWSSILLTYLLPALPLATLFDGLVSCLRTYSVDELQQLVDSLPENDYVWEIGEKKRFPNTITYLVGYPSH